MRSFLQEEADIISYSFQISTAQEKADDCGICSGDDSSCDRGAQVQLTATLDDLDEEIAPDAGVEPARRLHSMGRFLQVRT